jgi:hypothetical protein
MAIASAGAKSYLLVGFFLIAFGLDVRSKVDNLILLLTLDQQPN